MLCFAAMSGKKMLAVALLAAGVLILVYRGFSYGGKSHDAKLGPLEISVQKKERVEIPVWLGVAAVVAGAAILVVGKK